jgi:hypothetical protein
MYDVCMMYVWCMYDVCMIYEWCMYDMRIRLSLWQKARTRSGMCVCVCMYDVCMYDLFMMYVCMLVYWCAGMLVCWYTYVIRMLSTLTSSIYRHYLRHTRHTNMRSFTTYDTHTYNKRHPLRHTHTGRCWTTTWRASQTTGTYKKPWYTYTLIHIYI